MQRGVVVSALDIESEGPRLSLRGAMPPERLRYYLLYWDKIVVTDTNIFSASLSEEQQLLEQAEILSKSKARLQLQGRFDGSDLARLHNEGLAQIASQLISSSPGWWSIHQTGDRLVLPDEMCAELVSADIAITDCLPVPLPSVSIGDVLDFKEQRRDELLGLWQTLDELYLDIANAKDIPRANIASVTRLERAIKDLDVVSKQSWGARIFASRKVSLDINAGSLGQGITAAGIIGAAFSNPLIGVAAGAAQTLLSSMKFEVTVNKQLKDAAGKQLELSYLSALKSDRIVE